MRPTKAALSRFKDRKKAAKHFHVTEKTITRWQRDYGLYQPRENYGRKLDLDKAREIRRLYFDKRRDVKEIAEKFGVTIATIYRVINNLTYPEPRFCCGGTANIKIIYNESFSEPLPNPQPCAEVEVIKADSRSRTIAKTDSQSLGLG